MSNQANLPDTQKHPPVIGIVIPCFNEGDILAETIGKIDLFLGSLIEKSIVSEASFAYFVDDGSKDNTWVIIQDHHVKQARIKGLKFAGNAGHQNAIMAGMLSLIDRVDAIITLDADLQDDITCIPDMIRELNKGAEVVYGVRKNRVSDTFFKKHFALFFYSFMNLLGTNLIYNHADYRLISKKGLRFLSHFEERNLFLRGIFPAMKLSSATVFYDRLERIGGEPKYTFLKSLSLAWDGVTSFSVVPLRLITSLGFLISLVSLCLICWAVISKYQGTVVPGWASTIVPLSFLGGIQMLSLGIIGEYISKIYLEIKSRPRYLIDRELF